MRCILGIMAVVVGLTIPVHADEQLGKAAKDELKTLEGEWVVQRIETKDAKHEPGESESVILTIKGAKWTFGDIQEGEVIALDPTTNPKTLDLKSVRKGGKSTVNEAVYQVTEDVMVIAIYQGKDKKRPTNLDKPTEGETTLWTLKRAKK